MSASKPWHFNILLDVNTFKYWFALFALDRLNFFGISSANYVARLMVAILIHVVLNFLGDVLAAAIGTSYYDHGQCISRGYNGSAFLNDTLHSKGLDYGFNFYDGDYNKTRSQAQIDKFELAVKQLGIERGDRVIDVGCGCGDWLMYLKETMGCDVVGINITPKQTSECRARGLTVYCTDWKNISNDKELETVLYDRFDVVSFWDTVEHYVPMKYVSDIPGQNGVYVQMFELARNLLREKGKNRIWISCLHMRERIWLRDLKKMAVCYLLDKMHSGFYPCYYQRDGDDFQTDQLVDNAKKRDIECIWRKDVTYDYYITSVLEPTHFGRHKFQPSLFRVVFLFSWIFFDPYWFQRYVWFMLEVWMMQFDTSDISKSTVLLWWLVFKAKN